MSLLLMATIKLSLVLLATLAAARLLRRRSAALRHWVLAIGLACAAALPALDAIVPAWHLPVAPLQWLAPPPAAGSGSLRLTSNAVELPAPQKIAASAAAPRPLRIDQILVGAWAVGTLFSFAFLAAGAAWLRRVARRAEPIERGAWSDIGQQIARAYGLARPVTLLQSSHDTLLVTWGIRRPKVILPSAARAWSDDRIRIVLGHELAHVRRADWGVQLAAALLRAIWWFNPLVWIAYTRLRRESEYACDDLVLGSGADGAEYATHLLEVARAVCRSRHAWIAAPAIAQPSTLEQRIRAMLNTSRNRAPVTPVARAITSLMLAAATLAVAAAAVSAAAPEAPAPDIALAPPTVVVAAPAVRPAAAPVAAAAAQTGRGSLSGRVLDQLGGLVPGTEVTMTSVATGGAMVAVADRRGEFEFVNLVAGDYTLEAQLPGFRNVRASVSVAANAAHQRVIVLPIGSLQETITVTGERNATPEPPRARPAARRAPQTPEPVPGSRDAIAHDLERLARAHAASTFRAGSIGGQIKAPVKLVHVNPIYPAAMQAAGVEGVVSLVARIGVDGYIVEALQAREADTNSPVHPDLVDAAIAAVREWKMTPTLLNGVPVEVTMTVSVQFSLR
jgi:beta-lactamase regulating signal transducer with metallopeptidase domain